MAKRFRHSTYPINIYDLIHLATLLQLDRGHHDRQEVAEAQRLASRHRQEAPHLRLTQVAGPQRAVAVAVQPQEGAPQRALLLLRELLH